MQKEELNILFIGGAKRVSLAEKFIEEGKLRGINVRIFSYELDENVPIYFVATIITGLKWTDERLYDHLQEVIHENRIKIVLPFLDFATIVCARLKEMLGNTVFIPVSNEKICETFFDKKNANDWCLNNGIPVPSSTASFPLIAKPVQGSASKGILVLQSENDLSQLKNKEEYLVQQFIKGPEYSIDIYVSARSSEIISIVPRIRLETQGGESIKSITIKDKRLIQLSRMIIEKTGLIGPLTLQLIEDAQTKEIYFMEINPRFGGAVLNSIFAGANSPQYILDDFYQVPISYQENWQENFMMLRRFSEYYKICK